MAAQMKVQVPVAVDVSPLLCSSPEEGDAGTEREDDSSVDTEDAFLDMLGLQRDEEDAYGPIVVMDEEDEEEEPAIEDNNYNHKTLAVTPITLPPKCSRYGQTQCTAVTIDNFCSQEECQAILQLARTSAAGFQYITEASHVAPDGSTYKVQLQNPNPHKLAVLEHPATIEMIWKRLVTQTNLHTASWMKQFQAQTHCGPPLGLNPRIRVLKYDANDNDRFEPHFDATTQVGPNQTSRITVLLYLNEGNGVDFEGGETLYLDSHISIYNNPNASNNQGDTTTTTTTTTTKIIPQTGKLVLFEHDLYHSGAPLAWGTKHVMRTDILFERKCDKGEDTRRRTDTKEEEEEEEEAITASQDNDNGNADSCNPLLLVCELCEQQNWSTSDQAVLDDMGLLQSTLESFLIPGTALLTILLAEGGIDDRDKIDLFLKEAQQQVVINCSNNNSR